MRSLSRPGVIVKRTFFCPIQLDILKNQHYKHRMKSILILCFLGILVLTGCNLPQTSLPVSTITPGPSPTPSLVPLPTLIPTPLPSPTPVPAARIQAGEFAIFNGDYPQARENFQAALASNTDTNIRADALWGLGKADFLANNLPSALENLRQLTETYPSTENGIRGWFLLGETYFEMERYQDSAAAYQNYLIARPGLLDAYIQEKRGDAFSALGDWSNAQASYLAAQQDPGQSNTNGMKVSLANSYLNAGDAETALKMYEAIFDATTNDYLKAQMDLLSGRALLALGRTDEGYGRWRHAVDNYATSYDSYSALLGLVNANQPVDEFNRGLVDYFSKHYDVAVQAFDRYITETPDHDGTALYYIGLAQYYLGNYQDAVQAWNTFIQNYPRNRYWASAWDAQGTGNYDFIPGRAFTQWAWLDDFSGAASGLEEFVTKTVNSPSAPAYLFEAARIYERAGNLDKAAELWESLPDRFASDPTIGNAWFQAGIARYRQGNFPHANDDFQKNLLLATEPADRARSLLWVGKTYAAVNDKGNAASAWEQAQAADPSGYYSLRARDLLENRAPFAAPPSMNLKVDINAERKEAAAWLRIKFNLPPETDLSDLGALKSDLRFQQGVEFWKIGLYAEARIAFEDLRESVKTSPADSFRLGNFLIDLGMYRPGITAIREVLTLAGLEDQSSSLIAPTYFKHVRYGLYYADLIWPAAAENAFDPLFVTSVIRQESLFEGFVGSSAGARGLMQIMPETGASLASQMGWPPDFSPGDLYSPYISIRLGTFYFSANRRGMNNDQYAALAAYNSGPGNASIWQGLANGDLDLELEIIRYGETRDYIRSIYEIYSIYRGLYSPVQ